VSAALVALLAALPYLRVLGHGLVAFDDPPMITGNALVLHPGPAAFASFYMTTYQPLGWWLYAALHAAGGGDPRAYHAAALVLHAVNAALAFILIRGLLPRGRGAALAAGLAALAWAWHPVQVESVAWAAQLSDVLCASFVLAGLLARERGRPALGFIGFALAGLCRWKALAYPVFALALDLHRGVKPRRRAGEYSALVALALAVAFVNAAAKAAGGSVAQFRPQELSVGLLVQALKLLKPWPSAPGLLLDGGDNPFGLGVLGALAVFGAVAAGAAFVARRRPALGWAVAAFALAALPPFLAAAGPVPVFDHHLYLPSLALAALAAGALTKASRAARFAAAGAVAALGFATIAQAGVWRDSETLWTRVIEVHPLFPTARLNLAAARASAGKPELALIAIDEQLALYPRDGEALELRRRLLESYAATPAARAALENRAGTALFLSGLWSRAALRLASAAKFAPRDPRILDDAAVVFAAEGERARARVYLARALRAAPEDARAREALRLLDAAPPPRRK